MSSRTSRRMGLRGLVLGVAVSGISTLSSCIPLAIGAGYAYAHQVDKTNEANKEAVQIEANSRLEAARINADAVNGQNGSSGNSGGAGGVQRDYNNQAPRIIYFTCSRVIDLNNDDINDISENSNEVMDRGKTEFYVGDDYLYVAKLYNCKGRNVQIFSQCSLGGEVQGSNVYKIQKNPYNMVFGGKAEVSGSWHTYITMDDIKIADFRVNVKEDPARPIGKK